MTLPPSSFPAVARLLAVAALALVVASPVNAQRAPTVAAERLADRLAADALLMAEETDLTRATLAAAIVLLQHSVALAPDDADNWRIMRDLAELAEREDLAATATGRIADLDASDERMRWRRVSLALDEYQTVEDRIEAYERLLQRESREKLGNAVSSRLALDLALLHQRRGDDRAVGQWLAEATSLDPGHRTAAALAAGYFRSRMDDTEGHVELLINLLLADPVDLATQVELARLLLENGAYVGAHRMLDIATRAGGDAVVPGLKADLAISKWANGNAGAALRIIQQEQRRADEHHRDRIREEQPQMGALDLAHLTATLGPLLATVRAAIHDRLGDADAVHERDAAVGSYQIEIDAALAADPQDPTRIAELYLEQAWVIVWLGGDPEQAAAAVEQAAQRVVLSDDARARFDGWLALRRGDAETARTALAPLASRDPAARLGLAVLAVQRADHRGAARHLLDVARDRPGSLMSVWAAEGLFQIVGQRTPLHAETARPLENLVGAVPAIFDRYLQDPTLCLSLRVAPTRPEFEPYEPIMLEVEITNNSPYPLTIDRDGPIRPHVLLEVTASLPRAGSRKLPAIIVDIDRRVTIQPRQRLVVPMDLRQHKVGQMLDQLPMLGAILRVRCMVNFEFSPGGIVRPGALGSSATSTAFRVNGVRFTRRWIEATMADMLHAGRPPRDITSMALLSHIAGAGLVADLPTEDQQLFRDAVAALSEGWAKLDPVSQSWLLAVMQPGPAINEILARARRSEDRMVKSMYLMYCLYDVNDPMIDAARRDEDPQVRRLAEITAELVRRQQQDQPPGP